jgi:hypothetical protein
MRSVCRCGRTKTNSEMTQPEQKSSLKHAIDRNLKLAFESVESEGVPDRFAKLLDELKQAEVESDRDPASKG